MTCIATYNCNSIRNSIEEVKCLLDNNDILVLQELMLNENDVNILSNIDESMNYTFFVKDKVINGINAGRPSKGVAIFWKKCFLSVIPLKINEWLNGIIIESNIGRILIMNVYMPYDNHDLDSLDNYRSALATIESVLDEYTVNHICILGDFNADPNKGRFWTELRVFIDSHSLFTEECFVDHDIFTYLSPAHNTTSYIDHVLCSQGLFNRIKNVDVDYDLSICDHFPLMVDFDIEINSTVIGVRNFEDIGHFIDWNKFSESDLDIYHKNINYHLSDLSSFYEDIFECDSHCNNYSHKLSLDSVYASLVNILIKSSEEFTLNKKRRHKVVPGWNDNVKSFYINARKYFLEWKEKGKPRDGIELVNMNQSRSEFKQALKKCKSERDKIINNKIATSLDNKNQKEFWKQVRAKNPKKNNDCNVYIDGNNNPKIIVNLFSEYFQGIFCNPDIYSTDNYACDSDDVDVGDRVFLCEIEQAVSKLKPILGPDRIHTNHLKFAPKTFYSILTKFISSCLLHEHMPDDISCGEILPLIKDRYGKDSVENYRPIISSSVFLKVFEHILFDRIEIHLKTNDRQHGYKKSYSTSTACLVLKETISFYNNKNSPVYATFFDFSKAFDCVDHVILCNKLKKSGVPKSIVNFIYKWYQNQNVSVRFKSEVSAGWKLMNGVRQGGILSAYFFAIYINDILEKLSLEKVGCRFGLEMSNILAYADDIVLLSPSVKGLQYLIDVFKDEVSKLKLNINAKKTVCVKFFKSTKPFLNNNLIHYNGKYLKFADEIEYLGFILTYNSSNKKDIIKNRNSFYKNFNTMIRNFYNADLHVIVKLFKSYCMQFYGSNLWFNNLGCKHELKQFEIGFHKAVKRILNVPYSSGNHYCCDILGILTFRHFINLNRIKFVNNLFNKPCNFIDKNLSFLIDNSYILKDTNMILLSEYNVVNIFLNDFDAILARIFYVNNNEPRSNFLFVQN